MIETKYYLDQEGLVEIIQQLSEIIQSKTSDQVSQETINKFATIKTILDTNLSIGLNEDGSHIKTEGKFTDGAKTIIEEISALDTELYSLKETVDDLSQVAITGDYNDLSNKPVIPSVGNAEIEIQKNGTKINSFTTNQSGSKVNINITVPTGTAADKNIPSSGDASSTEVVMGNDTRLSDSRPASDVYPWAKAENKPSYEKSEIGLENVTNDAQVKRTEMGVASGVATLDSAGKVPSSQLPSYVDDILEYDTQSVFPETGEGGKIYVDKSSNTSWRWSGSVYTQIKGDLTIGTTSGTAADGKIVNDHINNTNNPHGVTKEQVGLSSVVNTGDSATPVSGGITKFTTGGAYTELAKKVDKVSGKELSTNDYTTDEKNKLSGIESGAQTHKAPTTEEVKSALGIGSGTSKYLREDGTWQTPPDTNTWRPVSDSVSSTDSSTSASSKAVKTAYDLAASKTSNTGTVTSVAVKMNGSVKGTVTTNGTIDLGTVITSHQDISDKADKSTTLSGYGITNAYTKTEIDTIIEQNLEPIIEQDKQFPVFSYSKTDSSSNTKVATIVGSRPFKLYAGALVVVCFTQGFTPLNNMTLNVGGTGAKSIQCFFSIDSQEDYIGNQIAEQGVNKVCLFTYTGNTWTMIGYKKGTLAELTAGTDTNGQVWSAKDLIDFFATKTSVEELSDEVDALKQRIPVTVMGNTLVFATDAKVSVSGTTLVIG